MSGFFYHSNKRTLARDRYNLTEETSRHIKSFNHLLYSYKSVIRNLEKSADGKRK